ncbi:uncharacterized protein BJ171DRAFT_576632 [Polychytrium aggregatum]|uniref:uncharacterized protein n=1 Tax=Polychytrium aggregatum TaxID=110093 RepID=UPI0022FE2D7B|nr:uncharacterized protein BJ171DRAFT_576632 [Polychytrium aggregatum]KAI9209844.1 hypothetical protein BJ171DRAFT_576632 [Polychytrium aggregatum]
MAQMPLEFHPNNRLINPRFESYKLRLGAGVRSVSYHPLRAADGQPTTVALDAKAPCVSQLPFKVLEFRSRFNNLFANPFRRNSFFFVDQFYRVIHAVVDETTSDVKFQSLYRFPIPALPELSREYPSSHQLLDTGIIRHRLFSEPPVESSACTLLDALLEPGPSADRITLCVSYLVPGEDSPESPMALKASRETRYSFRLDLLQMELLRTGGSTPVQRLASFRGVDQPYSVLIESGGLGLVVASARPFEACLRKDAVVPTVVDGPADAAVPIQVEPHLAGPSVPSAQDTAAPFEYMWMQSDSDVTLSINFREPFDKRQVRCRFERSRIVLSILSPDIPTILPDVLFDQIVPYESLWTLEGNRNLTLYLQKSNENTRWSQLFDSAESEPETLDPSELAVFVEKLEKYTAPDDGSFGHRAYAPGTVMDQQRFLSERSEKVDFEGRPVALARFLINPTAAPARTHVSYGSGHEWLGNMLVAGPPSDSIDSSLPGAPQVLGSTAASSRCMGLLLQSDVDALVYTVQTASSASGGKSSDATSGVDVAHVRTFDALGFVQASKTQKKYIAFTDDHRYALIAEAKKQLYIYQHSSQDWADQYLVTLDGLGEAGGADEVVGLGQIRVANGSGFLVLRDSGAVVIQME